MNFAAGQLLAQQSLADTDPVVLLTAEIGTEITQILIANTNNNEDSIPVSIYHSQDDPPGASTASVLYDKIHVQKQWTLDAPAVGGGIMLVDGDSLMVKGDTGVTVSVYGITADLAPVRV